MGFTCQKDGMEDDTTTLTSSNYGFYPLETETDFCLEKSYQSSATLSAKTPRAGPLLALAN